MNSPHSRISKPHPHRSGHRCEVRTPQGWRHGPTRATPGEAIAAAEARLAELDIAQPSVTLESETTQLPSVPPVQERLRAEADRGELSGVRILGPYTEAGGWRCKVKTSSGQQSAPMARTRTEALRLAERLAATLAEQVSITIRGSLDAYLASKQRAGARSSTITGAQNAVLAFFSGVLDLPVSRITPHRAQQQYDRLQVSMSVASHRAYLSRAKSWARWAVSKGWMRTSPLESIRGVGKRRRGKPQLSWDEGNRLGAVCLAEGTEAGAAVLMCLLMAMRVSEVLSRVVRDIDRGGTHMLVDDNADVAFNLKTESSRRPVLIPTPLRPLVAKLAAGKAAVDPLFPGTLCGRRRRQWLNVQVVRLCRKACVPVVCPHSLRGWMASNAVVAGELPEVVARGIGHASAKMTLDHYIAPGVAEAAQLARGQAAFVANLASNHP